MAEIRRKRRQQSLHIGALAVPGCQPVHGCGVAQRAQARPAPSILLAPDPGSLEQPGWRRASSASARQRRAEARARTTLPTPGMDRRTVTSCCSSACPGCGFPSSAGAGAAPPSSARIPSVRASASAICSLTTASRLASRRTWRRQVFDDLVELRVVAPQQVHDPIRRYPPPGPRGAGSPTSSVLSADSDFSTPIPPHFVFLRLAVPLGRPVRSRGSGPLPGPGLLFIAAIRAVSPVETSRPPRFLGDPCPHAPLSDPGGTASARPSRRRDGAFRCCHSVGFRDVHGFRGSITQPARLPVYASQPASPPVHATLGFRLVGQPWPVRTLTCWVA